jgi:hypothetical protein
MNMPPTRCRNIGAAVVNRRPLSLGITKTIQRDEYPVKSATWPFIRDSSAKQNNRGPQRQESTMTIRTAILTIAIAAALAAAQNVTAQETVVAPVTPPETTEANSQMVEADVRALMIKEGYTDINDVEFKEGTWTADAKSADGEHVEVRIDAVTGKIIPDEKVATIGKDEIIAQLQSAGYTNVHDVEMEGGVWKAEADNSAGEDVELKLDPNDGHVLGSEKDKIDD